MRIAIAGATGYIGSHLTSYFETRGHQVVSLGRELFSEEDRSVELRDLLQRCHAVINLAGASIDKRWTEAYKQELIESRVRVTRILVEALNALEVPPELFISASAVGYYAAGKDSDEVHPHKGDDFLARLCEAWETEARRVSSKIRLVVTRFGVVLSKDGGALGRMIRMQRKNRLGAVVGGADRSISWIALVDLCRAFEWIIDHKELQGVVNLTTPETVTQRHLAQTVKRACGGFVVTVPSGAFRLLLGERADVLLAGQRVFPLKLLETGFMYLYPTVEKLLGVTNHSTVAAFDLRQYMGQWYEIARYDVHFEKGMGHVKTLYTLLSNGRIRVENSGWRTGRQKRIVGRGKLPDPKRPGALKVAFFLWFYADYLVMELDRENYRYAVVGSSSDRYLWILGRDRNMSPEVLEFLIDRLHVRGYDTDKLIFTAQE